MRMPAALHPLTAEAVAFLHSRRQKERRGRAVGAKHFIQQCERSDTVYVVVTIEYDALGAGQRAKDTIHGRAHVRQQEWIAQFAQTWTEKVNCLRVAQQALSLQEPRDARQAADTF